jgi:hypothetical protein
MAFRKIQKVPASKGNSEEATWQQLQIIPGKNLLCTVAPVLVIPSPPGVPWGQVRRDLPEQLFASGLTWYWWYKQPPFQRLTLNNASTLSMNIQDWLANPGSCAATELCAVDLDVPVIPTREDVAAFTEHGQGSVRIVIFQMGDKGTEDLYVAPEVLTNTAVRQLLAGWNVSLPPHIVMVGMMKAT